MISSTRFCGLILAVSLFLAAAPPPAWSGSVDLSSLDRFKLLREVFKHVQNDYYKKDIKEEDLLTGSIRGILSALDDPYTRYVEPRPFGEMQKNQEGEFEGVGIVITVRDRMLTVVSPIDGTPAHKAGIQSGDRLLKIDGAETGKMTLQQAVDKIRGVKGTTVIITIWNERMKNPKDVPVVRDKIPVVTVKHSMVHEDVGYVRLSQFVETTADDLEKALHEFEQKGVRGIILDLRDNPGGLLQSAVDVSRKFLGKAPVITVKSRDGKTMTLSSYYQAHKNLPLVVLQSPGSASSSEIVAGAIQDNRRGLLLGLKSFGKGVIQTVYNMKNGGGLILTTAWYFTPSGRSIHEKGIPPDILLEPKPLTADQMTDIYDPNSHFEKEDEDVVRPEPDPRMETWKKYGVKSYDRQLIHAIEILRGERQPGMLLWDETVYPEEKVTAEAISGPKAH